MFLSSLFRSAISLVNHQFSSRDIVQSRIYLTDHVRDVMHSPNHQSLKSPASTLSIHPLRAGMVLSSDIADHCEKNHHQGSPKIDRHRGCGAVHYYDSIGRSLWLPLGDSRDWNHSRCYGNALLAAVPSSRGNNIRRCGGACASRDPYSGWMLRRRVIRIITVAPTSSGTTAWIAVSILPITDVGIRAAKLFENTVSCAVWILIRATAISVNRRGSSRCP